MGLRSIRLSVHKTIEVWSADISACDHRDTTFHHIHQIKNTLWVVVGYLRNTDPWFTKQKM